jgi:cytidine deaminase
MIGKINENRDSASSEYLKLSVREKRLPTQETIERGKKIFQEVVPRLMISAVKRHLQGVSYWNFKVGSAVVAEMGKESKKYKTWSAHNFKPWVNPENAWDKRCAEPNCCSDAIVHGADYIPGLVVVSNNKIISEKPEDQKHQSDFLHSCKNCRQIFRELIDQGIMSDETIIRFVNDQSIVFEDQNETEPYVGNSNNPHQKIHLPKLKLYQAIKDSDIVNLPYEQMAMGSFLNLEIYKKDGNMVTGKSKPPYLLVLPESQR